MKYKVGQKFNGDIQKKRLEIISIGKGYITARFKGSMPFVKNEKDFEKLLNFHNAKLHE